MDGSIAFVLSQYDLDPASFHCERIGKGHIHDTYRISGKQSFVLQKFNDRVFTKPAIVEKNIQLTADYLAARHPNYFFVAPIGSKHGRRMVLDPDGRPWRLSPYVEESYSLDEALSVDHAFKASAAFGKFARLLRGCSVRDYSPTIDRFHDLSFRYQQLREALGAAASNRKNEAAAEIATAEKHHFLVNEFKTVVSQGILRPGIFHNDTKINNVLFDSRSHEVLAVVDLDTLMPGYFIYDLGDLVRTIVSPVSEEEKDLSLVKVRREFYEAVVNGYLSEMGGTLSKEELAYVAFSGQMMTYIMALRFLADFLSGDTYYHTTYPGQNLVRAKNQFRLLELLVAKSGQK